MGPCLVGATLESCREGRQVLEEGEKILKRDHDYTFSLYSSLHSHEKRSLFCNSTKSKGAAESNPCTNHAHHLVTCFVIVQWYCSRLC